MFGALVSEARLSNGSCVLEIGCGTGLATAELVRLGFEVWAIDPDPRMHNVARERFPCDDVRFIEGRFEDFSGGSSSFDLVFSAGSWHWVDAGVALPLAASLLGQGGSLVVCWNLPRPQDSPRPARLDAVYRELAPELVGAASQVVNLTQEPRQTEIARSDHFDEPMTFEYQWTRTLSTTEYCELLSTHSAHRMLGQDRLAKLLAAVNEVIDGNGGAVDLAYETVMYVAHLRDS
jgi:SAM-dependent methyltransferase